MAKLTINDPAYVPTPIAVPAPPMMQAPVIAAPSKTTATATDADGRKITVRTLNPVHKLRLFAVAGDLAQNESWMSLAAIAWAVTNIDGEPVSCNSIREIEACLSMLGDSGLEGAAMAYISIMPTNETAEEVRSTAKN
jgi:hypothetical protein